MKTFYSLLMSAFFLGTPLYGALPALAGRIDPVNEVVEPQGTFPRAEFVKIAVLQWSPQRSAPLGVSLEQAEAFKASNRRDLANWVQNAAKRGAELIVTPEFGIVSYPDVPELPSSDDNFRNRADVAPYVETVPGPSTAYFGELARRLNIYIQVGFVEVDAKTNEYFNVAVMMNPQGEVAAKHRKVNFYGGEGRFLSAGKTGTVFEGPMGRVGIMVCADVYDYDLLSFYKNQHLDLILNSASWAAPNTGINYFKTGARETAAYMAASNMTYAPDSAVLYPNGRIQAHIRQSAGLAFGYVPRKH